MPYWTSPSWHPTQTQHPSSATITVIGLFSFFLQERLIWNGREEEFEPPPPWSRNSSGIGQRLACHLGRHSVSLPQTTASPGASCWLRPRKRNSKRNGAFRSAIRHAVRAVRPAPGRRPNAGPLLCLSRRCQPTDPAPQICAHPGLDAFPDACGKRSLSVVCPFGYTCTMLRSAAVSSCAHCRLHWHPHHSHHRTSAKTRQGRTSVRARRVRNHYFAALGRHRVCPPTPARD